MPLIIFSHANSYVADTYRYFFKQLENLGYTIQALPQYGHDARYPVTNNWPRLVQQLADFAAPLIQAYEGKVYLVGHSLGGYLSMMCAAHHPNLGNKTIAGVVAMDSPIVSGWRSYGLGIAKKTGYYEKKYSQGRISQSRRHIWPNKQAVHEHFSSKRTFARWHPQMLNDYIEYGTHDEPTPDGTQRVLSFSREVETDIYNSFPHDFPSYFARYPLRCPLGFIGGKKSAELKQAKLDGIKKMMQKTPSLFRWVDGRHLFPMEKPEETAQVLHELLQKM